MVEHIVAQGFEDEQRKLLVFFCLVRSKGLALLNAVRVPGV